MTLVPGMAFRCMEPPRHIYIPLFDPQTNSDDMLLVNLTTLRESCVDDTCILQPQDYPELTHATTVAYSRALTGRKSAFEISIAKGAFVQMRDIPKGVWQRIILGAHLSDELSPKQKRLLPPNRHA